jgi:hypothetical protein
MTPVPEEDPSLGSRPLRSSRPRVRPNALSGISQCSQTTAPSAARRTRTSDARAIGRACQLRIARDGLSDRMPGEGLQHATSERSWWTGQAVEIRLASPPKTLVHVAKPHLAINPT